MPEIKNTFLKSKMNKDLDARLIPNGEYREGKNISVSFSEGSSVGSLENIRGNRLLSNFGLTDYNLEIIGTYADEVNNRIYLFATNFTDSSADSLNNTSIPSATSSGVNEYTDFVRNSAAHYIIYCQLPSSSDPSQINFANIKFDILVSGSFLNFSKTHPILGINMIEDLLFFTDNRNQPRKINVKTAIANPSTSNSPYYTHEDHISVAKFAPYSAVSFVKDTNGYNEGTLINEKDEWLPTFFQAPAEITAFSSNPKGKLQFNSTSSPSYTDVIEYLGTGATPPWSDKQMKVFQSDQPNGKYAHIKGIISPNSLIFESVDSSPSDPAIPDLEASLDWKSGSNFSVALKNPNYNTNFEGDHEILEENFVRFSYRFKYEDDEYSLAAPFSQHAFVPKQYGYFLDGDDESTKESSIVRFMENQITTAGLVIELPYAPNIIKDKLKIKELQILYKSSSDENIKVIADLKSDDFSIGSPNSISISSAGSSYTNGNYTDVELSYINPNQSNLGSGIKATVSVSGGVVVAVTITASGENYRVGDILSIPPLGSTPAGSGATVSVDSLNNNFIYNYSSHKPIKILPEKEVTRVSDIVPLRAKTQEVTGNRIVYGNFLQNNETPTDLKYSLTSIDKGQGSSVTDIEYNNSTLKQGRSYQVGIVLQDRYGRSSNVIINDSATSSVFLNSTYYNAYTNGGTNPLFWPGESLIVDIDSVVNTQKNSTYSGVYSEDNPLGWYTYKVVVKQKEQDYYNVYVPGGLSGNILYTKNDAVVTEDTVEIKGLRYSEESTVFNMPLFNDNIQKISRQLKEVGPSDNIYSSSTVLYNRVNNSNFNATTYPAINRQNSKEDVKKQDVTNVRPFRELGDWTKYKNIDLHYLNIAPPVYQVDAAPTSQYSIGTFIYPGIKGEIDPFYLKNNKNPLIATLSTKQRLGYSSDIQEGPNWKFSSELMVFETKPFESAIEIYYETSTSGKISELNNGVENDIDPTGASVVSGIEQVSLSGWLENMRDGDAITNEFTVLNVNGSPISGSASQNATVNIHEVRSANGVVTNNYPFDIFQENAAVAPDTPPIWVFKLTGNNHQPFDENSRVENKYEVVLNIQAGSLTVQQTISLSKSNLQPIIYRMQGFTNKDIAGSNTYKPVFGQLIRNQPDSRLTTFLASSQDNYMYTNGPDRNPPNNFYTGYANSVWVDRTTIYGDYPICYASHETNGFEDMTSFNVNNDNATIYSTTTPYTSLPVKRLIGLKHEVVSATRRDCLFDIITTTNVPEKRPPGTKGRFYRRSELNETNVTSQFKFDEQYNVDLNAIQNPQFGNYTDLPMLIFDYPDLTISKSDMPNNYTLQLKGAWYFLINCRAVDASKGSGYLSSEYYTIEFIITR